MSKTGSVNTAFGLLSQKEIKAAWSLREKAYSTGGKTILDSSSEHKRPGIWNSVSQAASCLCLPNLRGRFRSNCRLCHTSSCFVLPLTSPILPNKTVSSHSQYHAHSPFKQSCKAHIPILPQNLTWTSTIFKTLTKHAAKKTLLYHLSHLPPKHGHSSRVLPYGLI